MKDEFWYLYFLKIPEWKIKMVVDLLATRKMTITEKCRMKQTQRNDERIFDIYIFFLNFKNV